MPLEWADDEVKKHVLDRVGSLERMVRTWFSGNDSRGELAEVDALLGDLTDQLGTGQFKRGTPQRARLDARIAALTERQDALRSKPIEAPAWRYEGTGETVSSWWERSDPSTRNAWLRDAGVRVTWTSHTDGGRTTVDEFAIDMGDGPGIAGATVLPGPMAGAAEAARAFADRDPAVAEVLAGMARKNWRDGDPLQDVINGE